MKSPGEKSAAYDICDRVIAQVISALRSMTNKSLGEIGALVLAFWQSLKNLSADNGCRIYRRVLLQIIVV